MKDPLISPIYGDFEGFPPTLLVSGTRDLFLSNTARTHIKLLQAGAVANILVFEAVSHADYLNAFDSPETQLLFSELDRLFSQHLRYSKPIRRMLADMGSALSMGLGSIVSS